jgi:type II secretion system protein N
MKFDLSSLKDRVTWELPFSLGPKRKSPSNVGKRKLYYFVYGLFVFLLVFSGNYLGDMAEPFVRARLDDQKLFDIKVQNIKTTLLPPRIAMAGVTIRDRGNKQEVAKIDKGELAFDFSDLLRLRLGVDFDVNCYGGTLSGSSGTGVFFNTSKVFLSADCDSLEMGQIPAVKSFKLALSGKASFAADIEGELSNINSLRGEFTAHCEKLVLKGVRPLFKVSRLSPGTVDMRISLSDALLRVEQFSMKGKKMSGDIAGNIKLDKSGFTKSKLDLKGQVKADLSLFNQKAIVQKKAVSLMKAKKAVPVAISETVGNPWVSLAE